MVTISRPRIGIISPSAPGINGLSWFGVDVIPRISSAGAGNSRLNAAGETAFEFKYFIASVIKVRLDLIFNVP
jgi:hypothetical protein